MSTNLNTAANKVIGSENARSKGEQFQNIHIAKIETVFVNHRANLCAKIKQWPSVVGCVAWLTDKAILAAMKGKVEGIVVQKEDWLRPDSADAADGLRQGIWRQNLRRLYDEAMRNKDENACNIATGHYNSHLARISNGLSSMSSIMCAGVMPGNRDFRPNMHHKFLVFGEWKAGEPTSEDDHTYPMFVPKAVWTGSFNFSENASNSFENAIYIEDDAIANSFYQEWSAVYILSEPLDWEAEYMVPLQRLDDS